MMLTINNKIISECLNNKCMFHFNNLSVDDIHKSIKCLQTEKTDAIDVSLKSDALIHSTDLFKRHLSLLLNSIIIHGYVPDNSLLSTMIPIIKNKLGDQSSVNNYRAIAISNLLGKVLDNVIL